nr:Na+/H+ antiporter subunit E [uncultured Noviherbaspirillum sp.]
MKNERWFPYPYVSAVLLVMWLMLNSTLAPAHLLLAVFLGWAIPYLFSRLMGRRVGLYRPLLALRLLLTVLFDIVVANLTVARLILGPRSALRPAFVRVPLDLREPYAVFTLACIITLTPGTVSATISEDKRWLLVHALDVDDEAGLIAEIRQRYERPLKELFAC